jgi:hypothetical protein
LDVCIGERMAGKEFGKKLKLVSTNIYLLIPCLWLQNNSYFLCCFHIGWDLIIMTCRSHGWNWKSWIAAMKTLQIYFVCALGFCKYGWILLKLDVVGMRLSITGNENMVDNI